jgi:hypothetical protein
MFAGHQTFHPRFGWLKKGFDAVSIDPEIFSRENAPVLLGVGKNMVEAIRFWCQAFKVITPIGKNKETRAISYAPTNFAEGLLGDSGLDPYLEDSSSLWLLHWMLCTPTSNAPAWWLFANEFNPVEFTDDMLFDFIKEKVESSTWKLPNDSSISKDVDALLRMYTRRNARGRQTIDDLLDSPFRDLGLILKSSTRSNYYRVNLNAKPNLSSVVVLLSALDYLELFDPDAKTISFTRLAYEVNSPGKIFRISLDVLSGLLADSVSGIDGIAIASPGGVQQLVINQDISKVVRQVAIKHFGEVRIESDFSRLIGVVARGAVFNNSKSIKVKA